MHYEHITTARDERIFTITINRPEKHNAVSPQTNAELAHAFDAFAADDDLWVAILTGAGEKSFCSGGDISVMVDAKTHEDYPVPKAGYGGITNRHDCYKPIIAAVNGFAFGGGFEMVMACDLAVASQEAVFGLPEPKIGTAAVAAGMHRLIREVGRKAAMEIMLTADPISAERTLELGLLNKIVPADQVLGASIALAKKLTRNAPIALQATKQCALDGLEYGTIKEAMNAQEAGKFDLHTKMLKSADIGEGLSAFMEKRAPIWTNS